MSCLKEYKSPRDKISSLLKSGALIRIKKGLYIFGSQYAKTHYYLETLANLIYGPSYVSKEYALSFYHLIPERVQTITSMTCKRKRSYSTPAGYFPKNERLTKDATLSFLEQKISQLDIQRAREDIEIFLRDPSSIKIWSADFFRHVASRLIFI